MVGSVATLTLGCYGESTKYGGPFDDDGGAAGAAGSEGLGGDANLGGASGSEGLGGDANLGGSGTD